ncbi:MAG TPA: DUF1905 domain-containing protein [Candidatus Nitrosocosmicus sp.]|nr:DUF1905 domain-containing protein [Candidatus Nitrosocosmicus sp.]
MKQEIFSVTDKLEMFEPPAAWTYIPIPSDKIPHVRPGGWGSIPIMATVGESTWKTSLFPLKNRGYFIPIKQMILKKEKLEAGELITIKYSSI